MVITIGLISARIMTFPQSIGIILGTNIGTTFKTELITFNIDKVLVPFAIFGALLILFKNKKARSIGMLLLGFLSFYRYERLRDSSIPLTSMTFINNFILSINDHILLSLFNWNNYDSHYSIEYGNDRDCNGLFI